MATYVLIHGAGDRAWCWHLVESELRERGHDVVAVDLPCEDVSAGLWDYAGAVVDAIADRRDLVVVGHSLGGFTAPLVCARVPVDRLVLVAGMVPAPGETGNEWWANTGYRSAAHDDDEVAVYYHDVPPELAAEAVTKWRGQAETPMLEPWPLDAWPQVPTSYLLCRDDRVFPADWTRRMVRDRLGIAADEIAGGHCPFLSRPKELAERLLAYRPEPLLDFYDAELRAHNERLRAAVGIAPGDHVLDIGCGAGQTTRDAGRAAAPGRVLGVDISAAMLERARQLTVAEELDNVTYALGDAQVHPFAPGHFDLAISRFGTMFFADAVAAFGNIARALRRDARLVLLVWQGRERNAWATAIDSALGGPARPAAPQTTLDPFSLGDPAVTAPILERAGFHDIRFSDVDEPVFYGHDSAAALEVVRGFQCTRDALGALDHTDAARVTERLRDMLAAHQSGDRGVVFDSRAWIVTARRR